MRMTRLFWSFVCVAALVQPVSADEIHARNERAKRLFEQGKYEEALEVYDDALLAAPDNPALHANRGSVLYRTERYEDAAAAYEQALADDSSDIAADIHYNRGNTYYRQGERMMAAGNQQATEKFKAALQEYMKTLQARPGDRDAKWNLQLAHRRIEQMKNMPQQQNKNDQQKKNEQNQQNQQRGEDKQQDQQKQKGQQNKSDRDRQDKRNKQQKSKQDKPHKGDKQKQPPRPQPQQGKQKETMKKQEAARLLRQFADDDKNLNKPEKKAIAPGARPQKDW